ncbi:hypothetical protein QFZ41_001180 [Luteibacter sp. W1I16]
MALAIGAHVHRECATRALGCTARPGRRVLRGGISVCRRTPRRGSSRLRSHVGGKVVALNFPKLPIRQLRVIGGRDRACQWYVCDHHHACRAASIGRRRRDPGDVFSGSRTSDRRRSRYDIRLHVADSRARRNGPLARKLWFRSHLSREGGTTLGHHSIDIYVYVQVREASARPKGPVCSGLRVPGRHRHIKLRHVDRTHRRLDCCRGDIRR